MTRTLMLFVHALNYNTFKINLDAAEQPNKRCQ